MWEAGSSDLPAPPPPQRVQNNFYKFNIPPLVLALSCHAATFRIVIPLLPCEIFKRSVAVYILHPTMNFKTLSHPTSNEGIPFPPRYIHPVSSPQYRTSRIPHSTSILSPIPHPTKPTLDPPEMLNQYRY